MTPMSTRGRSQRQGLWPKPDAEGLGLVYRPLRNRLGDDAPDGASVPVPVL